MANRIFSGVPTARQVLALIGFAHPADEPAESAARVRSRLIYQVVRSERIADPPSLTPAVLPQLHRATPRATADLSGFRDRARTVIAGAVQWSRAAVRVTMGAVRFLVVHAPRVARPVLAGAALTGVASLRVAMRAAGVCGFYARRFKRPILAGTALTAIAVIVAGGIWTLRAKVSSPSVDTPTVTSATIQPQQEAVVPSARSVNREPARASDPRRQTRSLTAAPAEPKSSSRAISPSAGGRHSRAVGQRASGTVDATVRAKLGAVAERPEGTPSASVAGAPHIATTGRLSPAPVRVYRADDADVAPPTPVNHTHTQGLALAGARDVGAIEVIIDEEGNVASAKAVVPPRTIGESMEQAAQLHAIKSWRFRPALKDGTPVRYLQLFAR